MPKQVALILALMVTTNLAAKKKEIPPDPALESISARGRTLAEYMNAVRAGGKAVLSLEPVRRRITHSFAQKTDLGWTVNFGRFDDTGNTFLVAYEAVQGASLGEFNPRALEPPREESGICLFAARAMETAIKDFKPPQQYDVAVLPADTAQWYVYLFPAQTQQGVYLYGGDLRYLVSPDGTTIVEKRQLHKSILTFGDSGMPRWAKAAGGVHTHFLSDLPEDTDVSMVLLRKPLVSETVGCGKQVYIIETDGIIKRTK